MSEVAQDKLQLSLGSLDHHIEDAKEAPTRSVLDTSLEDAEEESVSIAEQVIDEAGQAALKSKKQAKTARLLAAIIVKNAAVKNPQTPQDWIDWRRHNFVSNYGKGDPSSSLSNYGALQVTEGKPMPIEPPYTAASTPPAAATGAQTMLAYKPTLKPVVR